LRALESSRRTAAASLKGYLQHWMEAIDRPKVETGLFKLSLQTNSTPSVGLTIEPSELPERFQRLRIEAAKDKICDAWKAGETLPQGVEVVRGKHLRIR